jgi:lysophospholipase L1-like esterase
MAKNYSVSVDITMSKTIEVEANSEDEAIAKANEMVRALATEFGFRYIDVNDGLKDETGSLKAEYTRDGIHFDSAAYRTVFERLKQYL